MTMNATCNQCSFRTANARQLSNLQLRPRSVDVAETTEVECDHELRSRDVPLPVADGFHPNSANLHSGRIGGGGDREHRCGHGEGRYGWPCCAEANCQSTNAIAMIQETPLRCALFASTCSVSTFRDHRLKPRELVVWRVRRRAADARVLLDVEQRQAKRECVCELVCMWHLCDTCECWQFGCCSSVLRTTTRQQVCHLLLLTR